MKCLEIPYIFVSHDTNLLSNISNRIIHLEQVRRRSEAKHTVSNNTYDEYIRKRQNFIDSKQIEPARKEKNLIKKYTDIRESTMQSSMTLELQKMMWKVGC